MNSAPPATVQVIDSHTAGEPTRVVIDGIPDLGEGDLQTQANRFRDHHSTYRQSLILEPRGTDWLVGALLLPASTADAVAGVIFFNNVSTLGMCGHGMIGVVETLRHLGRIDVGIHRIETPVGIVSAELHADRRVSIANVESYRSQSDVTIEVPEIGPVYGDIAYGGNWFFLSKVEAVEPALLPKLQLTAQRIRHAIDDQQIRGADGGLIDHIELIGPADPAVADARSFVLCPGGEYDRSPCGTGTSAKLACLAADGVLKAGETWRQQSICGGVFDGRFSWNPAGDRVIPTITGRAFVTSQTSLRFEPEDPYRHGLAMDS